MSQRLLLVSVFLLALFASCSKEPQKPENLIDEEKYTDLLVELQLIRSYGNNADTDSTTIDSLKTKVFQKYGVSSEAFIKSHRYYEQFPQEQTQRAEDAIEQLKMDKVADSTKSKTARDTLPINH